MTLDALRAACARAPVGEKLVVAPSLAVGHQVLDALAMSGTPWVNLRIETVRTIADAVAAFDFTQRKITVLSRAQALTMIERACDQVLDHASYFAALAGRPGLHRAIQRSLDDLRHAGITAGTLPLDAFEDRRKADDLAAILHAYEGNLEEGRYADRYGVLARAIELLKGGQRPWPADALWIVVDDSNFTAKEGSLVALAAGTGIRLDIESHGSDPEIDPGALFQFRRAVGEENEIRGAFRAILASAIPFDDAELAYTTRDPYLPLTFELASEYGVPCTFAEGIAAHFTRPGQAAIAFLTWLGNGWHARELQKVARSGALDFSEGLTPTAFARTLRNSAIAWGRERYLERLDVYIRERTEALGRSENESRRGAIERSLTEAVSTREVVAEMLAMTGTEVKEPLRNDGAMPPSEIDSGVMQRSFGFFPRHEHRAASDVPLTSRPAGTGSVPGGEESAGSGGESLADAAVLANAAAELVARYAAIRNDADAMAREAIVRVLRELAAVAAGTDPLRRSEVTARLIDAVRAVHVNASNPRPGHLHVAPLRSAGWNGRSRLFLAGLDEERHPGSGLQDPVVLDAERDAINGASDPRRLQRAGDAPAHAREQFRHLMARTAARIITLSYSSLGLRDRRERFPSHSFVQAYRDAVGPADVTHDVIATSIPREAFVDPVPLSASDWWLLRRFADGETLLGPSITAAYPMLAAGSVAESARESAAITKWDGKVEGETADLDPRLNGKIYSASQLENLAGCPYAHFLQRVLRIEPQQDREFDPDRWLQAHEFGSLLHEVLEETMTALCAAHRTPSLAELPRMTRIANDAVGRWRLLVPPPNEAALESQSHELLRSCEMFLRSEEEACRTVTPKYFELSFGFGEESGLALPDPLLLDLGHGRSIRLRGRIDRVDHDEHRDEWHIWDYKSGSTFKYDRPGVIDAGRRIQHAIYRRALEAMLARRGVSGRVTRSGYFFPTPKGRGARIERPCSDDELRDALNHLFDTIATGWFPHASEDACKFCDFTAVCEGAKRAADRTLLKLSANSGNPAVDAWVALQGVV